MADTRLVKIENLVKGFEGRKVLDDVSFEVREAENLIIFGQSGTGKSVLLKCMVGLLIPDAGKIYIMDQELHSLERKELNELRKKIGFLFQGAALYDSMTVRENLEFPLKKNFKFSQQEIDEKVKTVLEHVSLEETIDKMPAELSGGMKKRIGLARAIITEPKIMLYDEPTTGLDPISSKEISRLRFGSQYSVVICAKIISDRVIFLKDTKIYSQGTIDELLESDDSFLQNFFSNEIIEE